MATIKALNSKLYSLALSSGFDKLNQQANISAASIQALNSSSLGKELNENLSGVLGLTTNVDATRGVCLLTENLTGLQALVVNDISSSKSNLDAITGSAVNNGFNSFIFAASTAEGIKSAVKVAAPTVSDDQVTTILTNTTPAQYSNQVADIAVKDFGNFSLDLSSASSAYNSAFGNILGSLTGNVLQDILLQTDATPINLIENLGVSTAVAAEVLTLLQNNKSADAVQLVVSETGRPVAQVETALAAVPTSVSAQIDKRVVGDSSTGVYDTASKNNEWNGSSTPRSFFDVIATQEQLLIEMIRCSREVTEVVFFGHEMSEDQVLTAGDIHDTYNAEGNDGIPFHFVILPNGNVQRGRPLSKAGTYSTTHSNYSIGVVIPHERGNPATIKQGQSAKMLLEAFYTVWPGGQTFDAYIDIEDASDVPVGINIEAIRSSFRKTNHGQTTRSFSTKQLISAAQGDV